MQKIVLIGENIQHSRSPLILNTLFAKYGIAMRYELHPLSAGELPELLSRMKSEGYRGANITSPHKERVIHLLDRVDPEAARIGAVNTIVIDGGEAIGYNTDIDGFRESLRGDAVVNHPFTAAVIGSGGAARAAVLALLQLDNMTRLTIYSRERERAIAAADRFADRILMGESIDNFSAADLVVHATPIGLPGRSGALLGVEQLTGGRLFYEMIYSPPETELLRVAAVAGLRTMNGESMLIRQALHAFEIWTGITPSIEDLPENLFQFPLSEPEEHNK